MTIEQTERAFTRGELALQVRDMKSAAAAGAEATPVLALHSGGFTSRQWRRLAEALAPTHPVVLPDFIGYGKSSSWPAGKPFSFHTDLEMARALLEDIGRPVHLVGHSYGGMIALFLAMQVPALVRSISVFEPVSFGIVDETIDADGELTAMRASSTKEAASGGVSDGWLESFVDWWNGTGAWKGMNDETKNAFRQVSWKLVNEVLSLVTDTTSLATYATIAAPTLFLTAETSPGVERRIVETLAKALPNASLERFAGAGHMAPITHAGVVNAAIVRHIEANDSLR
jgi:pimeloyl-ACP methyl ester carboxylesterase